MHFLTLDHVLSLLLSSYQFWEFLSKHKHILWVEFAGRMFLRTPQGPHQQLVLVTLGFSMWAQIQSLPSAPGSCSRGWAGLYWRWEGKEREGGIGHQKGPALVAEQAGARLDSMQHSTQPTYLCLRFPFWLSFGLGLPKPLQFVAEVPEF